MKMGPLIAGDQTDFVAFAVASRSVPPLQEGSPNTIASNAANCAVVMPNQVTSSTTVTTYPRVRATLSSFGVTEVSSDGPYIRMLFDEAWSAGTPYEIGEFFNFAAWEFLVNCDGRAKEEPGMVPLVNPTSASIKTTKWLTRRFLVIFIANLISVSLTD